MLTKAFNCPNCKKPFDCTDGEPKRPVFSLSQQMIRCHGCSPTKSNLPQRGLMEFLNQPAFNKTDEGYEYTLPIVNPICAACEEDIDLMDESMAFSARCGHYLCQDCIHERTDGTETTCTKCPGDHQTQVFYRTDPILVAFSGELGDIETDDDMDMSESEPEELSARLLAMEAEKERNRKEGALKNCGGCGIEQPVERLYKCMDCEAINCGNCSFDSHREHSVEKLLGVELSEIAKNNNKIYTETLEGLHGNIQCVQKNIDNAVEKVVMAGKDRIARINECTQYNQAQHVVKRIKRAAIHFEKHFEVYIPVARELATRLDELGEEIAKEDV